MSVDEATNSLTEELGRVPSAAEIGERLEISTEDVLEALEASHARRTMSLDAPRVAEEEAVPTVETIGSAEGGYERVEADLTAERAGLDDREWEVLRLRFVDELTQREIGRRLGVSQMQISRISRAVRRRPTFRPSSSTPCGAESATRPPHPRAPAARSDPEAVLVSHATRVARDRSGSRNPESETKTREERDDE